MPSNYDKGISKLLEDNKDSVEECLIMYILYTNSHYNSMVFPSTTLAKVYLSSAKCCLKEDNFKEAHKMVRLLLEEWTGMGLCDLTNTGKKNKEVYQLKDQGLEFFKQKGIIYVTAAIKNNDDSGEEQIMKSRKDKIKDIIDSLLLPDI